MKHKNDVGRPRERPQSNGLRMAADKIGGYGLLADKLKITHQAISGWVKIPLARVVDIERITGIPKEDLRPDVFKRRKKR
jgi:DNA-binding transcriptional regulator YdaS (Cro superfamily)